MSAAWWITVERVVCLPNGNGGDPLPDLVLGPFDEATALEELDSDSGTVYVLCTDDAKSESYIVDDVRAFAAAEPPAGERIELYDFIYLA